jgi:hypothetical protein
MGSKVSKPEASSASSNTGPAPLAAVAPPAAPAAAPVSASPATLENTGEPLQRGARIRVLKDTRSRKRNRNHRSHRRQRNRHGSRSRK